jgi:hypothetical protein
MPRAPTGRLRPPQEAKAAQPLEEEEEEEGGEGEGEDEGEGEGSRAAALHADRRSDEEGAAVEAGRAGAMGASGNGASGDEEEDEEAREPSGLDHLEGASEALEDARARLQAAAELLSRYGQVRGGRGPLALTGCGATGLARHPKHPPPHPTPPHPTVPP